MWLFTTGGFYSVHNADNPNQIEIRSRDPEDLINMKALCNEPDAPIISTPKADYPCRIVVHRQSFAEAMARQIHELDYKNFKNEIKSNTRHNMLMEIWGTVRHYLDARFKFWEELMLSVETIPEMIEPKTRAIVEDDTQIIRRGSKGRVRKNARSSNRGARRR